MLVNDNSKIYVGSTEVEKVYQGNTLIYEKQSAPYTPLSYIESTGTQIINTLVTPSINHELVIDYQFTQNTLTTGTRIFGTRPTWSTSGFFASSDGNTVGNRYYFQLGGTFRKVNPVTDYQRHTIDFNTPDRKIIVDGTEVSTISSAQFTPPSPIYLFGTYDGDANVQDNIVYIAYKMYSCKIYESGTLIKDYIPVLDQNNVACLYDKVNNEFVYNSGTGDFIGG